MPMLDKIIKKEISGSFADIDTVDKKIEKINADIIMLMEYHKNEMTLHKKDFKSLNNRISILENKVSSVEYVDEIHKEPESTQGNFE